MTKLSELELFNLKVVRNQSLADIENLRKELPRSLDVNKYTIVLLIELLEELVAVYDEAMTNQISSTKLVSKARTALIELGQLKELIKHAQPD